MIAVLALHGLACTVILLAVLCHSAAERDRRASQAGEDPEAILRIMDEHFPDLKERLGRGELAPELVTEAWDTCCAIHDARREIEELTS